MAEVVGVAAHLAVGLVGRLHGDEQRGSVSEVVDDGDGQHARRESHGFGLVDLVADMGPGLGVVALGLVEHHIDVADALFAHREGPLAIHIGNGEEQLFQGLGQLGFHLFGVGAGIDACHDALGEGEGRELVFLHVDEGIDTERYDHQHHDPDDLLVLDASADDASISLDSIHCSRSTFHFTSHSAGEPFGVSLTRIPSLTF